MLQKWYQTIVLVIILQTMAEGTRLKELQDGLNALKKTTDSQYETLETEKLVLKRQVDTVIQQLTVVTGEL